MSTCTSCKHCGEKTNENCSFDGTIKTTNEFTGLEKLSKAFSGIKTKEELNGKGQCEHYKQKGWRS